MKGRMSTSFWANNKNYAISRVAQTFMHPSKSTKNVAIVAASSCGGTECRFSSNGCSSCSSCSSGCSSCSSCSSGCSSCSSCSSD